MIIYRIQNEPFDLPEEKTPLYSEYFVDVKYKAIEYDVDKDSGVVTPRSDRPIPYVVHETLIKDVVDASKPLCDLKAIYARSIAAHDPSLLMRVSGEYGDFSKLPKNIFEAQDLSLNQLEVFEKHYNDLPDDVKAVFGSKSAFVQAVFDNRLDQFVDKLKTLNKGDVQNA